MFKVKKQKSITGVRLSVESWENDGDNSRTESVECVSMEAAEELARIIQKHDGYGNGEWNPECTPKERDLIGDLVGYECYGGEVRVLDHIFVTVYSVVDGVITETVLTYSGDDE